MKKILFVLSNEKLSGGEKIALDIAQNLKKEIDFIFFLPNKPQNEFAEFLKDFKIYFPQKSNLLFLIHKLKIIIDQEKPLIIHSHGTRASIFVKFSILLNLNKKFKHIYTFHGIHFVHRKFPFNLFFLIWEKITNRLFVDILTFVGNDDYYLAKKIRLIKEDKSKLIENGIDFKEFENIEKGFLRENFNIKNKIILTTICRLHYQKDIETLIRAISLIKNENLILFIVGDGPDKENLEDLTRNLNLENKIRFLGYQKEVKKILVDSDIFVLSTRWEGLPLVILEAAASKKPIIASNVHGIKSLIDHRENGLLFEKGNEKDLAEKIKILLKDEILKKKLSENAYKFFKEKYSLDKMINNYKFLYFSF